MSLRLLSDVTEEQDTVALRSIAALELMLRVVCYVDHPMLTLAAGEALVDHYSREPSNLATKAVAGVSTTPVDSARWDVVKAELVVALANVAVLSSQVWPWVSRYVSLGDSKTLLLLYS